MEYSSLDTWSLIRNLFAREQYHLHQIERLESSLLNAGTKNQTERTAFNTLQGNYDKLQRAYDSLHAEYQRLKREFELFRYHHHCQYMSPEVDDKRVREIE
jgi:phage shock protein A